MEVPIPSKLLVTAAAVTQCWGYYRSYLRLVFSRSVKRYLDQKVRLKVIFTFRATVIVMQPHLWFESIMQPNLTFRWWINQSNQYGMFMFKNAFQIFKYRLPACFLLDWVLSIQSCFDWVLYNHHRKFPMHKKIEDNSNVTMLYRCCISQYFIISYGIPLQRNFSWDMTKFVPGMLRMRADLASDLVLACVSSSRNGEGGASSPSGQKNPFQNLR